MNFLILEDSIILSDVITKTILQKYKNANVTIINKEKLLIKKNLNTDYNLVIIDYSFAYTYIKKIKTKNILIISGFYKPSDCNYPFLKKPINREKLLEIIEELL